MAFNVPFLDTKREYNTDTTSLFGTWTPSRKITLFALFAAFLVLVILVNFPLGLASTILFVLVVKIWRSPYEFDQLRDSYFPGSTGEVVARAVESYKIQLMPSLQTPRISLGFGPPIDDPDHELAAGWKPPTRLSSWWCLVAAIALSLLEWPLQYARFPFWGFSLVIPWWVTLPVSLVFWFMLLQSICHVERARGDRESIIAMEPKPAVMIDKAMEIVGKKDVGIKAGGIAGVIGLLVAIVVVAAPVAWWWSLVAFFATAGVVFLIVSSVMLPGPWNAEWQERMDAHQEMSEVFASIVKPEHMPVFVSKSDFPDETEWEKDRPDEPYAPNLHAAAYTFSPGTEIGNFLGKEKEIASALGSQGQVYIAPLSATKGEDAVEGSVGNVGMFVWWSDEYITLDEVLTYDISSWTREFAVSAIVMPALREAVKLKSKESLVVTSCNMMTRKTSDNHLFAVQFVAPVGTDLWTMLGAIDKMKQTLGVEWLRILPAGSSAAGKTFKMMIGDDPTRNKMKFRSPSRIVREDINNANWQYWFYSSKLRGSSGVPQLKSSKDRTKVDVTENVFSVPEGLSFVAVQAATEELKTSSNNRFMEISLGRLQDDEPKKSGKSARFNSVQSDDSDEQTDSSVFTIVSAPENPLKQPVLFSKYEDEVFVGRKPGVENLKWSTGMGANGSLFLDDFNGKEPHLMIAGTSGSGKSVVLNSMLLQLEYNNSPDELELWLIEPKIGLQNHQFVDNVKHMVDSNHDMHGNRTGNDDFFKNVAEMSQRLVEIQLHRNDIFSTYNPHGRRTTIEKLKQARAVAKREGPDEATGEPHPFMLPYIVVIVEECATLFADSPNADDKEYQKTIVANFTRLAREGRSAGIHLVFLTQYPTKAALPPTIKQQTRRVGLSCQNSMASQVVIDENGLEDHELKEIKGTGKLLVDGSYRMFRGFYVLDGDFDAGEDNDVVRIHDKLPLNERGKIYAPGRGSGAPGAAIGSSVTASGDGEWEREIEITLPDKSVFDLWESTPAGQYIGSMTDEGRVTKAASEKWSKDADGALAASGS